MLVFLIVLADRVRHVLAGAGTPFGASRRVVTPARSARWRTAAAPLAAAPLLYGGTLAAQEPAAPDEADAADAPKPEEPRLRVAGFVRGLTPASNLAFAFMAITIVVAEFGGRWAAIGTALASALSLDFFLTQPYLRLSIEDNHDVIAFVGLAVCGLIAAALGSQRNRRIAALTVLEKHRNLVRSTLRDWDAAAPAGPQLASLLRACQEEFPLAAAVVRDVPNNVLASAKLGDEQRGVPEEVLQPDTLLPGTASGREPLDWGLALPGHGGRIALASGGHPLGWLDVWGSGMRASAESRRALSDLARLLGVLLASMTGRSAPTAWLGA